jgi:uncharacterized DUF497 family protein
MEFEWSLYKANDSNRFAVQNRFFSLGCTNDGRAVFAVYTSTGKIVRVLAARLMTEEETYFYERKTKENA